MRYQSAKLILAFAAAVLLASPVVRAAEDIRTVDMTVPLLDEAGKPLKDSSQATTEDPKCNKCGGFTLGIAIDHALKVRYADEQNLPGEQNWARALLGDRIKSDKAAKLTVKEADTIERLVMKAYQGPLIAQIVPKIDPNRKVPELQ
jgi:hypothetical protein